MTLSTNACRRAKPLLGTYLTIELKCEGAFDLASRAFERASQLESQFSLFRNESEISKFNRAPLGQVAVSAEFSFLLTLAFAISQTSKGAFRLPEFDIMNSIVTKRSPHALDLNGIAKGAVVDWLVELILTAAPEASGTVNAGGDLRRFGVRASPVQLRLGPYHAPTMRTIEIGAEAIATSSFTIAENDSQSSTNYEARLRPGLERDSSATVIASTCAVADALTKVALFAEPSIIAACAEKFAARILIFDSSGEVTETYGYP